MSPQPSGVRAEQTAGRVSPISESDTRSLPNFLKEKLRERPDITARAAIVAAACALFWLTWTRWGSIQIDCGRDVYVPYQILHGKLLYRDLWYPYGPLQPYLAAGLLKEFGQHLLVFYFFGFAIVISCALLLLSIGEILGERAAGLVTGLTLLLQGFGPGTTGGQHNFIFAYAYAATLGLLLALLCLLFTLRHLQGRAGSNLILAGLAAGLTPALQAGIRRRVLRRTRLCPGAGGDRTTFGAIAVLRRPRMRSGLGPIRGDLRMVFLDPDSGLHDLRELGMGPGNEFHAEVWHELQRVGRTALQSACDRSDDHRRRCCAPALVLDRAQNPQPNRALDRRLGVAAGSISHDGSAHRTGKSSRSDDDFSRHCSAPQGAGLRRLRISRAYVLQNLREPR